MNPRRHHRHRRRPDRVDTIDAFRMGWSPGANTPAEVSALVEQCQRLTHDALIAELGPRRRSGVRWLVMPEPYASEWLDAFDAVSWGDIASQDIRDRLGQHGGYLVVATCRAIEEVAR